MKINSDEYCVVELKESEYKVYVESGEYMTRQEKKSFLEYSQPGSFGESFIVEIVDEDQVLVPLNLQLAKEIASELEKRSAEKCRPLPNTSTAEIDLMMYHESRD